MITTAPTMHLEEFKHIQKCLPPRYNWSIVESGIKHHNPPKWVADAEFGYFPLFTTCINSLV
jgi:hypothetical protein